MIMRRDITLIVLVAAGITLSIPTAAHAKKITPEKMRYLLAENIKIKEHVIKKELGVGPQASIGGALEKNYLVFTLQNMGQMEIEAGEISVSVIYYQGLSRVGEPGIVPVDLNLAPYSTNDFKVLIEPPAEYDRTDVEVVWDKEKLYAHPLVDQLPRPVADFIYLIIKFKYAVFLLGMVFLILYLRDLASK